jgi:hypothetical protein
MSASSSQWNEMMEAQSIGKIARSGDTQCYLRRSQRSGSSRSAASPILGMFNGMHCRQDDGFDKRQGSQPEWEPK